MVLVCMEREGGGRDRGRERTEGYIEGSMPSVPN